MAEYKPLFVYLEPASIPQVVAHIQKYLAENPIVSDPEAIAEAIQNYIEEHPEIIAVASVNGKTGNVVLTGSDIMINPSSAVSVETQLLNLASMINNTGADITQIQANISQIYTNIETIQTDVETNTSNISALQTSVEGQGTRLAGAETDIDNLETAQTAQGTRLNTAEGNISSLQTRMTQAETDIDSNESNINTLQTNIGTLQTDLNAIATIVEKDVESLGDGWYSFKLNNSDYKLLWKEYAANIPITISGYGIYRSDFVNINLPSNVFNDYSTILTFSNIMSFEGVAISGLRVETNSASIAFILTSHQSHPTYNARVAILMIGK